MSGNVSCRGGGLVVRVKLAYKAGMLIRLRSATVVRVVVVLVVVVFVVVAEVV